MDTDCSAQARARAWRRGILFSTIGQDVHFILRSKNDFLGEACLAKLILAFSDVPRLLPYCMCVYVLRYYHIIYI